MATVQIKVLDVARLSRDKVTREPVLGEKLISYKMKLNSFMKKSGDQGTIQSKTLKTTQIQLNLLMKSEVRAIKVIMNQLKVSFKYL